MPSFDKTVDQLRVTVSEPWPRMVRVEKVNGDKFPQLTVDEIRDLHWMLGRAMQFIETQTPLDDPPSKWELKW